MGPPRVGFIHLARFLCFNCIPRFFRLLCEGAFTKVNFRKTWCIFTNEKWVLEYRNVHLCHVLLKHLVHPKKVLGGTSIEAPLLADKPACQAVRKSSFRKMSYRWRMRIFAFSWASQLLLKSLESASFQRKLRRYIVLPLARKKSLGGGGHLKTALGIRGLFVSARVNVEESVTFLYFSL